MTGWWKYGYKSCNQTGRPAITAHSRIMCGIAYRVFKSCSKSTNILLKWSQRHEVQKPLWPMGVTAVANTKIHTRPGWKISRYFRKYRKYPILSIYMIWNLLPNNSMCVCVCALHIRWSTLVIHTALLWKNEIWQKLSNTEKMLRAQVISQQNAWTENQNIVTMCHI